MIATIVELFFPAIVDNEQPLCFLSPSSKTREMRARALPSLNLEKNRNCSQSTWIAAGFDAATVSQIVCKTGTGKGFIMRLTHELLALFFHVFTRAKTSIKGRRGSRARVGATEEEMQKEYYTED